ncbi:MAG: porphobilinogen synthase [Thermoproteota archaeon]|nr:porphobilinogen synthase [Thermoproteota archaeon]
MKTIYLKAACQSMRIPFLQRQNAFNDEESYKAILASSGLSKSDLIFPILVSNSPSLVKSMPGIAVTPLQRLRQHVQSIADNGISSIIVFGIPKSRDPIGSSAFDRKGIIQNAIREIKPSFGNAMTIMTDVCICQYNLTGHCGILSKDGRVDNDATLKVLAKIAVSHAEAGADVVAPSAMMDGQVYAVKRELHTCRLDASVLSFSAKHASSLYTPFRSATFAKITTQPDKSSYQVSYSNLRLALREIETDINEGADMVMIKPALTYLDLVRMVKDKFNYPVAVQNVSGEYAIIKAAAMQGWINEEEWKVHCIASIKRAGADKIISYFVLDVAKYL